MVDRMVSRRIGAAALLLLPALIAGCGGGGDEHEEPTVLVSGSTTGGTVAADTYATLLVVIYTNDTQKARSVEVAAQASASASAPGGYLGIAWAKKSGSAQEEWLAPVGQPEAVAAMASRTTIEPGDMITVRAIGAASGGPLAWRNGELRVTVR